MADIQRITLQIGAHNIVLEVPRTDERSYREATKLLNRRYLDYARRMPKASAEQVWVYVALEMAVNLRSDAREKSLEPIDEQLAALNQRILQALQDTDTEEKTTTK